MKAMSGSKTVARYLADLEDAARGLPVHERRELVDEIRAHITAALAPDGNHSEAEVHDVLDSLGRPDEIVRAAGAEPSEARAGAREILTVLLIMIGGLVIPVGGWLAGVVLLWSSPAWRIRQKLLGTFVVPGGLMGAFALTFLPFDFGACSQMVIESDSLNGTFTCAASFPPPWLAWLTMTVVVIAPIVTAMHLLRTARAGARA